MLEKIALIDIDMGERGRKTYTQIEELAQTIQEKGLIQPITVMNHPDGEHTGYLLVAGGRRYRAHEHLELTEIDCIIRDISGAIDFAEIELIENMQRQDLRWDDQCEMELKLHELRLKADPGQSIQKTADEMDVAKSTLHRHLTMARSIREVPALGEMDSFKDASKFMTKIEGEMVAAQLAKIAETDQAIVEAAIADGSEEETESVPLGRDEREAKILAAANNCYKIGDCIEGMAHLTVKFDFAEVDPPYGIDLKNAKRGDNAELSTLADYNERDDLDYAEWLYTMYDEVYASLEENAFAICWFGMTHFTNTKAALLHAGFTVNDVPGIWVKGSGQTQQPTYNLANAYEPFFIARKGKAILTREGVANAFPFAPVPGTTKIHPTQRPIDLIKDLLTIFCQPGAMVLVPFLGSGTTIRAARSLKMLAMGWDLSETYKNAFLMSVQQDLEDEYIAGQAADPEE